MVKSKKKYFLFFVGLGLLLLLASILNICTGSVAISVKEIWKICTNQATVNANYQYIITQYRLPKTIASILVGTGLGLSGLMMQTLFKNPLAGPFVLGISSGASLGVALVIMGGNLLGTLIYLNSFSIPMAACLGSFLVLAIVMLTAQNIKNTNAILIIGLMFGSFTAAMISILSYFSTATELQQYVFWSFGSLQNLQWSEISILTSIHLVSIVLLITIVKPLDALLLGDNYAKSLGISIKKTQTIVFITTSLLTGSITAFVGPIAFIGLAIPHISKLMFNTSNHQILLPAVGFTGAIVMIVCDTFTQVPLNGKSIPINAITSLFGAPIVIWLLVKKSKKMIG